MDELDSEKFIARIDRGRILDALCSYPEQIRTTFKVNISVRVSLKRRNVENIIVAGVGGSGIAGDVMRDWLTDEQDIQIGVCRSTRLPKFADSRTLAICVSYSGNTKETLSLFHQARKRKCSIVSVTSGGELQRLSRKSGIPVIQIESGRQPRVALPSLVTAVGLAVTGAGVAGNITRALKECSGTLEEVIGRVGSPIPHDRNEAKQVAAQLLTRWTQVLALERNQSLARRFVAELNEMSKLAACYSLIPEFSHNMIEGWPYNGDPNRLPLALFSFRDASENKFESRLFTESVMLVAERSNAVSLEYKPRSRARLSMLLESIAFGDWVSFYLAILRGVDPTEVPTISQLKRRIEMGTSPTDPK